MRRLPEPEGFGGRFDLDPSCNRHAKTELCLNNYSAFGGHG